MTKFFLLHWIDIASVLVCRHRGTLRFKFLKLVKAVTSTTIKI